MTPREYVISVVVFMYEHKIGVCIVTYSRNVSIWMKSEDYGN